MKSKLYFLMLLFIQTSLTAQWIPENISDSKHFLGAAANEDYIIFAGGNTQGFQANTGVDIYSIEADDWIQQTMPTGRNMPGVAMTEDHLYVAGGSAFGTGIELQSIDVYDLEADQWTTENLSLARGDVKAVYVGNKVLFAGGGNIEAGITDFETYDVVDIYDLNTQTWDTAHLSQPRFFMTATALGDKAFFAGGAIDNETATNRVDIYDASTNTWSIDSLSQARMLLTATSINNKVLFAGGNDILSVNYDIVDIYNIDTEEWSTATLSLPRMGLSATTICDQAYFIGGGNINWSNKFLTASYNRVDIYDAVMDEWTIDSIPISSVMGAVASSTDRLIYAGGWNPEEFGLLDSGVSTACISTSTNNFSERKPSWLLSPNPVNGSTLRIQSTDRTSSIDQLSIYNLNGQQVFYKSLDGTSTNEFTIEHQLNQTGLYLLQITDTNGNVYSSKLALQSR